MMRLYKRHHEVPAQPDALSEADMMAWCDSLGVDQYLKCVPHTSLEMRFCVASRMQEEMGTCWHRKGLCLVCRDTEALACTAGSDRIQAAA